MRPWLQQNSTARFFQRDLKLSVSTDGEAVFLIYAMLHFTAELLVGNRGESAVS